MKATEVIKRILNTLNVFIRKDEIKTINGQSLIASETETNIEIKATGGEGGGLNPDEDIELSAGKGVVMTSDNGTRYKLYIDNDGRITTEAV